MDITTMSDDEVKAEGLRGLDILGASIKELERRKKQALLQELPLL